jgi:hypothetical protein
VWGMLIITEQRLIEYKSSTRWWRVLFYTVGSLASGHLNRRMYADLLARTLPRIVESDAELDSVKPLLDKEDRRLSVADAESPMRSMASGR